MSDDTSDNNPDDKSQPATDPNIDLINIEDEMKRSYLDYAMSVIVSRALPDVRDGLKPVHRRILYAMQEGGYTSDKKYRKSAAIVGDVMGKYHPHGDSAIYDALVRLAQPHSMSLMLVDGQGNFGSIDNDPPAAMRYTESRMAKPAEVLLTDIQKNTVDFRPNYDESAYEPSVLPAQFPNLLVNGGAGIAVGMSTNIPPHNLGEVIAATLALIDDPSLDDQGLLDIIPGPDFPTGGLIMGQAGSQKALLTGRGPVIMRAKTRIENFKNDRERIIVEEIPYQVNKAAMVEKIAELVRDKRVEGISDLRDESDRHGVRVVIELKRDASGDVVLNQLFRYSQLQTSFGVNMLALNQGRPELLNVRTVLECFIRFREEVVARRTKFDLNKARDRCHNLVGLALAVANIDEVIAIIRQAPDPQTARAKLLEKPWPAADMRPMIELIADRRTQFDENSAIRLSDEQARQILELRLHRLTALGRDEIGKEAGILAEKITEYLEILSSRTRIMTIIKDELSQIKDKFAVPRRSEFAFGGMDMEDEDLIEREDMVVTFTHGGYVKRVPLATYRTQHRGGKGRSGMTMKDNDFITRLYSANTHTEMLFFSSDGMVYKEKVWRLPMGSPQSRGKALVNMFPLDKGERITSVMPLPDSEEERAEMDIVFATRQGGVRRNKLSDFVRVNRNGKIAMKPDEGDGIVAVEVCSEADDILLTTAKAQCIRFQVSDVRVFVGRTSSGVRGIRLAEGDQVISMAILRHVDITSAEARAYLRKAAEWRRLAAQQEGDDEIDGEEEADSADIDATEGELSAERLAGLSEKEQLILTVTDSGMGKRASAYDYRVSGRGGKGFIAQRIQSDQSLVASFPVEDSDQVMLVTNAGQLIRTPVDQIRQAGRATTGVWVLRTAENESVVSVERLAEEEDEEEDRTPDQGPTSEAAPMSEI